MSIPSSNADSPPPDGVFAEMLRAARALLAMRDPLDVELVVSEMLGAWWGKRLPGEDAERVFGEGLIDYAAAAATPAALALLTALAHLGTTREQRLRAEDAAADIARRGVALPPWGETLGRVRPRTAYVSGSRFGDAEDLICTFVHDSPTGESRSHAVIAVIDYNAGGLLRDAWVTTQVRRLLSRHREEVGDDAMAVFHEIGLDAAQSRLEVALHRTGRAPRDADGDHPPPRNADADHGFGAVPSHHALLSSRSRALPTGNASVSRHWPRDERATLAARFLASEDAADLSDSYAASRCVDHIIAYGCEIDFGRPLRVSPRKIETFLLTWLPRRVVLLPAEQEAMPHVLAAWIRWAGPRYGLTPEAVHTTLDALWEATRSFGEHYQDPAASLGLRQEVVRRLLPDGDLEALPRRMFAFPLLASDLLPDKGHYTPTTAAGRRALLRLDHFNGQQPSHGKHSADSYGGSPELEEALDQHERLAKRLWDGDPPNLWAAAQRLLDRGHPRLTVLETLIGVIEETHDAADLRKRLDEL